METDEHYGERFVDPQESRGDYLVSSDLEPMFTRPLRIVPQYIPEMF